MKKSTVLILDNIRSLHNVGSLFRTADATGVEKLYLVGVTPDPIDRFGREVKEIEKTALGAEKEIPWEHAPDILELINKLKDEGYIIVALEQDENSMDYKKIVNETKDKNIALILGEEVKGIQNETLKNSDYILELPMKGKKESLNVSVAGGVALYLLNS